MLHIKSVKELNEYLDTKYNYVLFFSAKWCKHCIALDMDKIAFSFSENFTVLNIDSEDGKSLYQYFGVTQIPTFIVIYKGKIYDKFIGGNYSNVLSFLERCAMRLNN